jgi:hypothetical protein
VVPKLEGITITVVWGGLAVARMKFIMLRSINWCEEFEPANGDYYDYVAKFVALSEEKLNMMCNELRRRRWQEVKTNNGIVVFLKDKHVVRIYPMWDVTFVKGEGGRIKGYPTPNMR